MIGALAVTISPDRLKELFPHLLDKLNRSDLQNLMGQLVHRQVSPGEELHRCGSPADSLILLVAGALELSLLVDGISIRLGTLKPGQLIGSVAVIEPDASPTSVTASQPSEVLTLDHEQLNLLRSANPRLGGLLLRALSLDLAERLRYYEEGMAERLRPPDDASEFAQLCRPLMGIKES